MYWKLDQYCKADDTDEATKAKCKEDPTLPSVRGHHMKEGDTHVDDGMKEEDGVKHGCVTRELHAAVADGTKSQHSMDMMVSDLDASWRPTNEGEIVLASSVCEYFIFEPINTGSLSVEGCDHTDILIVSPKNSPPASKTLSVRGGAATIVGGENTGALQHV